MKKTFALAALAACTGTLSATVIVPVSVTGPAGDAGSSTDALINSAGLRDPGDSPVVLITGDALATAQLFNHRLDGGGHVDSWTLAGTTPAVFVFDLTGGGDTSIGTALLWQYGNDEGTTTPKGNSTMDFELIFHTDAEGAVIDFGTEAVDYSNTMAQVTDTGSANNNAQTFQFASENARYVGLRIVNNYGTPPGGDRLGLGEVAFATEAVPEPSSAALLGLGSLALILRRRK